MILALFTTMRPRQWSKNIVVLAPLFFDRQLGNLEGVLRTAAALALFCLLSSSVYIVNDLVDMKADQQHPKKKLRPLPSGQLSIPAAVSAAVVILTVTLTVSYLLSPAFFAIAAGYFLLNLAYSKWLKHIALIDVMVIAAGFVLRVAGGVSVIHVKLFSPWLYVVTTLLALYLGFGKRRAELALLDADANSHRKVLESYTLPLLDQIITIISGSTLVAYCLYTFLSPISPDNHAMMLTIPFVIYGIFRYLYLVQVKHSGGAPEDMLLTDRPLQLAILLYSLTILIIFYAID